MFFFLIIIFLIALGMWSFVFIRRHLIILLISLEFILLALNLGFIFYALHYTDITGLIYGLLALMLAAVDSVIGLAILVVYYRVRGGISVDLIALLKG